MHTKVANAAYDDSSYYDSIGENTYEAPTDKEPEHQYSGLSDE